MPFRLVALAILAVALVVAVVVAYKRGRAHDQLQARHGDVEAELAANREELAATVAQRDETARALEEAQRQHAVAREDTETARAQAEAAAAALVATNADLDEIRHEVAVRRASELDPAVLWSLELARTEREWRADGAPSPSWPSPLDGGHDELAAAVQMRADCLRETAGFIVDLDWQAEPPGAPATALAWFRVLDELLTHASRHLDGATVAVADGDGVVVVTLTGGVLPEAESLTTAVVAAGGPLGDAHARAGGESSAGEQETGPTGIGLPGTGETTAEDEPPLVIRLVRPPSAAESES